MRFFSFTLWLVFIAVVAVLLSYQPGEAQIVWHGYVIETSAAFLAVALLIFSFILYIFQRIWRFLREGPRFWRLRHELRNIEKGQRQLTQGLVAIAAGNAAEAGRFAINARRYLGVSPATQLLQAQAAQLAGDHRAAREIYTFLASKPDSAVLGYRGLIMAALRERNWDEAERQADKLRLIKPDTPWLNLIRFELSIRRQNWVDAGTALRQAEKAHLLEAPRAKLHQAALLAAASDLETQQGNADKALQLAEQAVRQAPQWMPARIALARKQLATGHVRAGMRTVEKTWAIAPHPQLAALYRTVVRSNNVLEVYKQIERLTRVNNDHPISQLVLAESALAADLWGEARRHLMALIAKKDTTQAAYRLLARLERRESGDERAAAQWLMKATEAPPDPRWLCTACGGGHDEWRAPCAHCGGFNTLEWQTPGIGRYESTTTLIPGALEGVLT